MAQLDVICWLWGSKYAESDVARLSRRVQKHLDLGHRFHVFADRDLVSLPPSILAHRIRDENLIDRRCFCRLRMFDPEWQREHGLDGWIWSLDLDLVITGRIDDLVSNPRSDFMILREVNEVNPNPLNGSMMLLRAGAHPEVWSEFSLEKAQQIQYHEFPDDQGWIWHMIPDADGWKAGTGGVYGFQKPGWPGRFDLPSGAKIVAFIGRRKPHMYSGLPWIRKHWLEA